MKKGSILTIVIIVIIVIIGISKYNSFVRMKVEIENAWAEVDNQLKRRYELIPNYVETVKGYAKHEKEVFTEVTKARASVGQATTRKEAISANNELTGVISRLLLVVERYPELKANTNFIRLQDELAGTENRLAVARRRYNESVKNFNKKIAVFPNNIIAGIFGFTKEPFYEIQEVERETPDVGKILKES
ncbi:MAG: LemA family protein [Candidatus Cloacimonetes bacterium]|nr:LemA family protein [Candidatus Cloacimonadota bacterium]MBL7086357.1 LemA family protein [Candidatus Cloacimonadota bacterium]